MAKKDQDKYPEVDSFRMDPPHRKKLKKLFRARLEQWQELEGLKEETNKVKNEVTETNSEIEKIYERYGIERALRVDGIGHVTRIAGSCATRMKSFDKVQSELIAAGISVQKVAKLMPVVSYKSDIKPSMRFYPDKGDE